MDITGTSLKKQTENTMTIVKAVPVQRKYKEI